MKEITQQYSYVISDNKQWLQQWKTLKQWQKLKERTTYNIDDDDATVSKVSYMLINGTEISVGWWYIQCTIVLTAHWAEHKFHSSSTLIHWFQTVN